MSTTIKEVIEAIKNYKRIQHSSFKVCGSNTGEGVEQFKKVFPNREIPERKNSCICGHTINKNYYITDGDVILVLGSVCIKRFKTNMHSSCENCGIPHKNRKDNKCKKCRVIEKIRKKTCEDCGNQHKNRKDNKCNNCRKFSKNNLIDFL